jgi:hypothetical protein
MSRRIEIELTSARDDGTWTWRAAGAKEPRGTVPGGLLPGSPKVGDVLRVEAEFFVDGIQITSVVPPKSARQEPERLELIAPTKADEPLVTSTLASRGRDDRRPRGDGPRREGRPREGARREGGRPDGARREGGPREGARREGGPREGARREGGGPGDAGREGGPRREGEGEHRGRGPRREGERPGGRREGGNRPPRRTRPEPPPMPAIERPKAKRLRPGRAHRNALLESLPEDQRRIAEQVVLGGLPAVRQAIDKQNEERKGAGEPAIAAGPLVELAEKLVPRVRAAEWRDRAEAALRDLEHLDLRDLRSVVSAADARTKDPELRALAEQLQAGLVSRVDAEHHAWLEELTATLDVGRIVRALRVSSRPPKAGAPLPADLSARLTTMAGEALTAEAAPERWVAVLDALAFAPVRDKVIPTSLPTDLHTDVRATIARLATRIPKVAHIFEIEPDPNAPRPKPERRRPPKPKSTGPGGAAGADQPKKKGKGPRDKPAKARADAGEQPAPETTAVEQPTGEQATAEPTAAEQAPAEQATAEGAPAEKASAEEKAMGDQAPAEQAPVQQAIAEQPTSEQHAVEPTAAEQAPAQQTTAEQHAAEPTAAEQAPAEQPTSEQHTAEPTAAEQAPTEQPTSEQVHGGPEATTAGQAPTNESTEVDAPVEVDEPERNAEGSEVPSSDPASGAPAPERSDTSAAVPDPASAAPAPERSGASAAVPEPEVAVADVVSSEPTPAEAARPADPAATAEPGAPASTAPAPGAEPDIWVADSSLEERPGRSATDQGVDRAADAAPDHGGDEDEAKPDQA